MGLAIDGNEVHGIARGGQAFVSIGNTNTDGSLSINGQDYLSESKMKITDTGEFDISISANGLGNYTVNSTVDVTNQLSNYKGYVAICIIYDYGDKLPTISQPIFIPVGPSTYNNLTFDNSSWSGTLSMDSSSSTLTFTPQYKSATLSADEKYGHFYVLSNN